MPFTFRQLLVWGKVRDIKVDLELEGAEGMPGNLIAFAMALMGGLAGSLPGPGTGTPRVGARVLKVKRLINFNKLNPLAGKRKFDLVGSGSCDLDSATKRVGVWKPSVQKGPIPMSPRADPKTHFSWISSVGEETMGEVTMSAPDNSTVCQKFRTTRSYTHDYKCASCPNRHSVLAPDTITILLADQHAPDSMPPNADGSCTLIVRLFNITIEELCFLSLGPLNNKGANWEGWKSF